MSSLPRNFLLIFTNFPLLLTTLLDLLHPFCTNKLHFLSLKDSLSFSGNVFETYHQHALPLLMEFKFLVVHMGLFCLFSRGDTQDFADLDKLAKRFLKGNGDAFDKEGKEVVSRAYIQEVVQELRKGEQGECPICLEAFEDAVLTSCAHRLCRECLLASWRNSNSGLCPVCRYICLQFQHFGFSISVATFCLQFPDKWDRVT